MTNEIIRRPDFAGGGLTEAEKLAMAEHSKLWIARAMRTEPIDPTKIVPAILGLYEAAGLKAPRVVIAPSPLVMAFAYGAAAEIWRQRGTEAGTIDSATDSATRDATYNATRDATYNATSGATDSATRDTTYDATYNATGDTTRNAIRGATGDTTRNAIRGATRDATAVATDVSPDDETPEAGAARACRELAGVEGLRMARQWANAYQGGNMWAAYDCYLTAARDILGLRLPEHEKYAYWEQAAIEGGFRVMHEEFCIVSDFPEILRVDAENRPHAEDGPSHRWRDGWSLYHWHGVKIPGEWIEDRKSLTPEMALTWPNIEQRRAACEILGWLNILSALDAKTIDTDADPEIGELVEVNLPDSGRERFLRVVCGTKRQFALPVPPEMRTALEANAWTYGFDADTFIRPEIRT